MGFIEIVNKYAYKLSINKTLVYKNIMDMKEFFDAKGLKIKIKNVFDLLDYEVIYRGMKTQFDIENAYEMFVLENYDLFNYLNYDEKRKMFNNDIASLLEHAPHFYDENSQTNIYIPYFESFINQRYCDDYQLMMLKQHREYINQYKISINQPQMLYHIDMYKTDFCSLVNVYEDYRHICYYFDELKTIYIFKKDTHELLNSMIICDHALDYNIDISLVRDIASLIESYQYVECLNIMFENALIGEKTYQKIMKKYK